MLGVKDARGSESTIPEELLEILREDIDDRLIYADFIVSPLTEYEEGVMQFVRVEKASNIVMTRSDMEFLRRVSKEIKRKRLPRVARGYSQ